MKPVQRCISLNVNLKLTPEVKNPHWGPCSNVILLQAGFTHLLPGFYNGFSVCIPCRHIFKLASGAFCADKMPKNSVSVGSSYCCLVRKDASWHFLLCWSSPFSQGNHYDWLMCKKRIYTTSYKQWKRGQSVYFLLNKLCMPDETNPHSNTVKMRWNINIILEPWGEDFRGHRPLWIIRSVTDWPVSGCCCFPISLL